MQGVALGDIQKWTEGRVVGILGRAVQVHGVSTDTRTIGPGDLFVALKGERRDGHEFVEAAFRRGAAAAVVAEAWAREIASRVPGPLLVVESPLQALGEMAQQYRRRFDLPVVCVTGSAGKTTTKEMVSAVLGQQYRVLRNRGNENNEIGVPRTVLQLQREHQALVLELGARRVGDIEYLCAVAQPTTGVLLNIGTAHLGVFGSVERVAKAKGELLECLDESATALINVDDCAVAKEAKRTKGRLLGFSLRSESEFRGERLVFDKEGCGHFSLQQTSFDLCVPGKHNVYNALAAAAVGCVHDVPLAAAASALSRFEPLAMRSSVHRRRGWTIFDDTYNANPESARAALDLLTGMEAGRRIAVLGDMLELGPEGPRLHFVLGQQVASAGVDLLWTLGPLSREIGRGARKGGMGSNRVHHFDSCEELAADLHSHLQAGDVVLIKGSRAMRMDAITRILLEPARR